MISNGRYSCEALVIVFSPCASDIFAPCEETAGMVMPIHARREIFSIVCLRRKYFQVMVYCFSWMVMSLLMFRPCHWSSTTMMVPATVSLGL